MCKFFLLLVVTGNILRAVTCPIYTQWGLNLATVGVSRVSEIRLGIPGISFSSFVHDERLHYLAKTL